MVAKNDISSDFNQNDNEADSEADEDAKLDPEVLKKISLVKSRVHETFGQISLAMMSVPRYRHLSLADLNSVLLEPLIRDRVSVATVSNKEKAPVGNLAGVAIWASVSDEVDAKIREQIGAGVFPVRLKPEDWTSGETNWLLDILAPHQKLATAVVTNFQQVVKDGQLRIHPLVARSLDPEILKKMQANTGSDEKEVAESKH